MEAKIKTMQDYPNSTNVSRTEYNEEKQIMTVEFKNGKRYEYYDVPVNVWTESLATDSIGKFIQLKIKGNYTYKAL